MTTVSRRIKLRWFIGYERPFFELKDGQLIMRNVPVQKSSKFQAWVRTHGGVFNRIRAVELGGAILGKLGFHRAWPSNTLDGAPFALADALFDKIRETTSERGAKLVMLFLPSNPVPQAMSIDWLIYLREYARLNNIAFIDVYSVFHTLKLSERKSLFSSKWGHFSIKGNRFVADIVEQGLIKSAERLNGFESTPP